MPLEGTAYPGVVFRQEKKDPAAASQHAAASTADSPQQPDPVKAAQAPKGRPTPSRKEAEAARREQRKIPADPKAARRARKERLRLERAEARAGMMSGDQRYLPRRDQGPAKAFTRDYVDGKRRVSEYFVFLAVGILVAGFIRNIEIQSAVSTVWFAVTFVVAAEIAIMLVRLNRELKRQWPEKADRKGCLFYGSIRALQVRKLRVPAPRVRPGGTRIR